LFVRVIFDPLNVYLFNAIAVFGVTLTLDPVFFSIAFKSDDFAIENCIASPKSSKSFARVTFTVNKLDVFWAISTSLNDIVNSSSSKLQLLLTAFPSTVTSTSSNQSSRSRSPPFVNTTPLTKAVVVSPLTLNLATSYDSLFSK
jgi:hypothetical protein